LPSLLALPLLGFVDANDETYHNTRKMILSKPGNPYFLSGKAFEGIGGPHIGLQNAWPMSLLVQAMTSDDDEEIGRLLEAVKMASPLGLIHESVDVDRVREYTRKFSPVPNLFPNCPLRFPDQSSLVLERSRMDLVLTFVFSNRELVRLGQFRLRADDPRSCGKEAASALWQGRRGVRHRLMAGLRRENGSLLSSDHNKEGRVETPDEKRALKMVMGPG